jgi:hypothetical protein
MAPAVQLKLAWRYTVWKSSRLTVPSKSVYSTPTVAVWPREVRAATTAASVAVSPLERT